MGASGSRIAEGAYTGTATVGRIESSIGAIVGTLVGGIIIAAGIYMQVQSNKESAHVLGKVTNVRDSAQTTDSNGYTSTTYYADVVYRPSKNGKECTIQGASFGSPVAVGDLVDVYFNPKVAAGHCDPDARVVTSTWQRYIGGIVAGTAALFVAVGWLYAILALKYKPFAAAEGVGAIAGFIR